mgnify:CR=1 FL=1
MLDQRPVELPSTPSRLGKDAIDLAPSGVLVRISQQEEILMKTPALQLWLALGLTTASLALAQPDGALDTSFGDDGWDYFNPAFATPVDCSDMAVRPDGRFAITGDVYSTGPWGALSCVRNTNGGTSTCITLHYDLGGESRTWGAGIAVQSVVDQGSTFTLILPASTAAEPAEPRA